MISMTPYSAFMLGAATNTYGTNLANFWVYNPENYKFEDIKRSVHQQSIDISPPTTYSIPNIHPGLCRQSMCGATGQQSRGIQTSAL